MENLADQSKQLNQSEEGVANAGAYLDSDSSLSLLSGGKGNKDILGMLGEELYQQTDFMCEEWNN